MTETPLGWAPASRRVAKSSFSTAGAVARADHTTIMMFRRLAMRHTPASPSRNSRLSAIGDRVYLTLVLGSVNAVAGWPPTRPQPTSKHTHRARGLAHVLACAVQ